MPELPDVEYFKIYFKQTSLHKKITQITCDARELIQSVSFNQLKQSMVGTQFTDAHRRGKLLLITIDNLDKKLGLHFAMTGKLHYVKQDRKKEGDDRFTRLTFRFENGYELRWINMRKLGKVYLVSDPQKIDLIAEMGPEPLDLTYQEFARLLTAHENQMLKSFFMDQSNIAGIGNVYSDEILFRAQLHPRRKVNTLSESERERLYNEMQQTLSQAITVIKKGRPFSGNEWLIPHRNQDDQCPRNKNHHLQSQTVSGRTALFCPQCQPK